MIDESAIYSPADMLAEERETVDDGLFETLAVMDYEKGAVAQNLIFAKNQDIDTVELNALYANALTEIGDLVAQAAILQEKILEQAVTMKHRPSWDEVVAMGRARQVDRMRALRNGTMRDPSLSFGG